MPPDSQTPRTLDGIGIVGAWDVRECWRVVQEAYSAPNVPRPLPSHAPTLASPHSTLMVL